MNFPFYIAKRYLFARKSHNAINIISLISIGGVAVGTMALIVVLSVFNGFDNLVQSLFNSFNPDLLVTIKEGKAFVPDRSLLIQLKQTEGVEDYAEVLEDKALLKYDERQTIAIIKGVDKNYGNISGVDSMMRQGEFVLEKGTDYYAVVGEGIAYFLNISLDVRIGYRPPLSVYVPRRIKSISFNPERAINRRYITPNGMFSIEQDFDSKYIFVPLEFSRDLFGYSSEVTSIEVKLSDYSKYEQVQKQIQELFGTGFEVKNRFQQNQIFYKTMETEKWIIFLILVFILAVASFNVIGSLTMLILEKKSDIGVLTSLGADMSVIKKVFLTEGWLITVIGAFIGLIAGLLLCWVQIKYKIIGLPSSGSFVIDSYPVAVQWNDVFVIIFAVLLIGYFAAWYPIRFVTRKFITPGEITVY
ncbi:MAG: ABC transporter permease [Bacteroidales bacterium]|nr:ABC transporter permease [Bacteroidales bacterium]